MQVNHQLTVRPGFPLVLCWRAYIVQCQPLRSYSGFKTLLEQVLCNFGCYGRRRPGMTSQFDTTILVSNYISIEELPEGVG
jgi:hypothetical protein